MREANGLSANARLSVRQTLAIPSPSTTGLPAAAVSKPAATVGDGSRGTGSWSVYRVRSGDTLFSIARQFSTTVPLLKQWNGLTGDQIKVGDQLRIRG